MQYNLKYLFHVYAYASYQSRSSTLRIVLIYPNIRWYIVTFKLMGLVDILKLSKIMCNMLINFFFKFIPIEYMPTSLNKCLGRL